MAASLPPSPFPPRFFFFLVTVCHPPADFTVASLTEFSSDACDLFEANATTALHADGLRNAACATCISSAFGGASHR